MWPSPQNPQPRIPTQPPADELDACAVSPPSVSGSYYKEPIPDSLSVTPQTPRSPGLSGTGWSEMFNSPQLEEGRSGILSNLKNFVKSVIYRIVGFKPDAPPILDDPESGLMPPFEIRVEPKQPPVPLLTPVVFQNPQFPYADSIRRPSLSRSTSGIFLN